MARGSVTFQCVNLNYVISVLHFDEIPFVSDTWEEYLKELNYFALIVYFIILNINYSASFSKLR